MADGSLGKTKNFRSPEARIAAEIEAAKALRHALGTDADDEELYHIAIDGETSLNEMIDAILANIAIDQELLDGIAAREDDLAIRKNRLKERIGYRKAKIEQALLIYGEKIERPEATLSLSQRQASIVVTDEAEIPSDFWKMRPELDRTALRRALEDGKPVAGACLNNAPQTLTIRRK
jgi:hypothetical protein